MYKDLLIRSKYSRLFCLLKMFDWHILGLQYYGCIYTDRGIEGQIIKYCID